jgi:hypothetical protein
MPGPRLTHARESFGSRISFREGSEHKSTHSVSGPRRGGLSGNATRKDAGEGGVHTARSLLSGAKSSEYTHIQKRVV